MNEKNFEYLRDQVRYSGFGDSLQSELREKMQQGPASFELFHNASFGKDRTAAVLYFRKSDQQDMYFFNKYLVVLRPEDPMRITEQTFFINKGNNITLKEAYNLLSGRAVNKDLSNKEGQVYNAWLQLDFKQSEGNGNFAIRQFHQNYGFDLERALTGLPIKELGNEQEKSRLLESLRKGNLHPVTLLQTDGREAKHFLEVSPQFKAVHVYDEQLRRVRQSPSQQVREGGTIKERATQVHRQRAVGNEDGPGSQQKGKRRGKSIGS